MQPSYLFQDILRRLDVSLATYVNDVTSNVITAITPVATNLMILYVILWGWAMMRGAIKEPVMDGMQRVVRIAIIIGIALNVGRYNAFLADWLWHTPEILAGYVAGIGGSGTTVTNTQYLDGLLSQVQLFGNAYWQKANGQAAAIGGIPDFGMLAMAFLVWAVGLLAIGYAFFLLILSKIALSVLLGVGPIFVLMTLFQPTKRMFDLWMGQALTYVFLVMCTAAVIRMIMSFMHGYFLEASNAGVLANPHIDQGLAALAISGIAFLMMLNVPSISAALGGGVAVATMGAVNWTYDRMTGTASSLRPTSIRRTLNRTRADAVITGRVGKAVVTSPVNLYRKITTPRKQRVANQ